MMRPGSPPIFRIASARVMPFQTCVHVGRLHVAGDDAAAARPRPKATPSSADQTTISSGWRVRTFAAASASMHAQRRERSQIAVEVAAVRHRIDVRTEEDRRQGRVGAGAAPEDVAGRIDAGLEPGRRASSRSRTGDRRRRRPSRRRGSRRRRTCRPSGRPNMLSASIRCRNAVASTRAGRFCANARRPRTTGPIAAVARLVKNTRLDGLGHDRYLRTKNRERSGPRAATFSGRAARFSTCVTRDPSSREGPCAPHWLRR